MMFSRAVLTFHALCIFALHVSGQIARSTEMREDGYNIRDGPPFGNGPPPMQRRQQQTITVTDPGYNLRDGPPFGNVPGDENGIVRLRPGAPEVPSRRMPIDRSRENIFVNRPGSENPRGPPTNPDMRPVPQGTRRLTSDPDARRNRSRNRPDGRRNDRRPQGVPSPGPMNPRRMPTDRAVDPYPCTNSGYDRLAYPVVALSAIATSSQHFPRNYPVIFDHVITEMGGGYDSTYGIFTAPVSGLYQVSYYAMSQRDEKRPAILDLIKNGYVINSAAGSGSTGSPSNSAILSLSVNDRIFVQGRQGTAIFCEKGYAYCSFNVVLLHPGYF